jgi:hypothetical protein
MNDCIEVALPNGAIARIAALSTARRVRLHNQSVVLYDHLRSRYRAAYGTAEEERLLLLLARAYARELRRALPTLT